MYTEVCRAGLQTLLIQLQAAAQVAPPQSEAAGPACFSSLTETAWIPVTQVPCRIVRRDSPKAGFPGYYAGPAWQFCSSSVVKLVAVTCGTAVLLPSSDNWHVLQAVAMVQLDWSGQKADMAHSQLHCSYCS